VSDRQPQSRLGDGRAPAPPRLGCTKLDLRLERALSQAGQGAVAALTEQCPGLALVEDQGKAVPPDRAGLARPPICGFPNSGKRITVVRERSFE